MFSDCHCRTRGFNCNQGRDCPERKKAEPDHFWILYLLCFMVGLLGCSVVTFFGDWQ